MFVPTNGRAARSPIHTTKWSPSAQDLLVLFLRDDVQIDVGSFGHEPLDREVVEILAQAVERGAADDGLRDAVIADVGGVGAGGVRAGEVDDGRAKVGGEAETGVEGAFALGLGVAIAFDVEDVELGGESFGEACAAHDEVAGLRVGADADGNLFGDGPVSAETLAFDVVVEGAVDGAGDALEGHLAERDEVAAAEEVGEGALDAFGGVDVAATHAGDEGFGGEVADDDLVGAVEDPVGDLLTDFDPGEGLDAGGEAFDVLDVDGGEDVDLVVEEAKDVFVAFGGAAVGAGGAKLGVGEFVDEDDLGHAGEDGVDIHLGEEGAFVLDFAAGDLFEAGGELGGAGAAMGFDEADDDVFAATTAANAFAEHGEGLADAGGVAKEDFEAATLLLGVAGVQPVFRRLSLIGPMIGSTIGHAVQFSLMNSRRLIAIARWVVLSGALAGIILVYRRWVHVNPTTVALTLLLLILVVAAEWGLRYAVVLSLAATAAYNFYFLPPIGTFTINDPQNWLALFSFLVTAIVASRLSERARDQTIEARGRQAELEVLFRVSRELLESDSLAALVSGVPTAVASVAEARSGVLYLLEGDRLYRAGSEAVSDVEIPHLRQLANKLNGVVMEGEEIQIPLRTGVRPKGLVVLRGAALSLRTAEAIGGLISLSIDRVQALETVAKGEAVKEAERLRTLMIDSITHELRTPLTSVKGAATALLAACEEGGDLDRESRIELLTIIDEESDRLNRLVSEAVETAQLDAQQIQMHFGAVSLLEVVMQACEACAWVEEQHAVTVLIAEDITVHADAALLKKVVCNLVENAGKYSKAGTPVTISAEREGDFVAVSVADRGVGIDPAEQTLIFERFYRAGSTGTSGTGMGLAITRSIIEAHGGTIEVRSQPGEGSVFTFTVAAG